MKRARNDEHHEDEAPKKTTHYSNETRNVIVGIARYMRGQGKTWKEIHEICVGSNIKVGKSTLRRWVTNTDASGVLQPTVKRSGRPSKLSADEKEVFAGWMLNQRFEGIPVTTKTGMAFIKKQFKVKVGLRTVENFFRELGFSRRQMKKTASGYRHSHEELIEKYSNWITKHRAKGRLSGLLCSVDATYTSHRADVVWSWLEKGSHAAPLTDGLSSYTNTIYTFIWSDGVNRTPCIMFTHNPAFNDSNEWCTTETRQKVREDFYAMAEEYGISPDRVVYIKSKSKKYVGEKVENIKHCLDMYNWPCGTILSDRGNGFGKKEETVFDAKSLQHVAYPSAVHQWLSPNDCNLHGRAKAVWRTNSPNWKDDVKESLYLMYLFDQTPKEKIINWFKNNLFLDGGRLTTEAVSAQMGEGKKGKSEFHRWCEYRYLTEVKKIVNFPNPRRQSVEDSLDGNYWQRKRGAQ